jgi:hypothetical protein
MEPSLQPQIKSEASNLLLPDISIFESRDPQAMIQQLSKGFVTKACNQARVAQWICSKHPHAAAHLERIKLVLKKYTQP